MPARSSETEGAPAENALALPISITDLIAIRDRIIQAWKDANAAMEAVDTAFAAIWDKDFTFYAERGRTYHSEPGQPYDIEERTHALDFCLYQYALLKLNITKAMTEKARDEFLEKIKAAKTPFEERHLVGLAQNADKLFRDSSLNTVHQVFDQLTGVRYNGPGIEKKDNLRKIEKVFRTGGHDLELDSSGTIMIRWSQYHGGFHFNDLLTACRLIEGKGFTDYSNDMRSLCNAVPKGQKWVETEYFRVERFLNRNVKVNWNEDKIHILEKLNAIGSGRENTMPDTMRKRYKKEHFHDDGMPHAEEFFKPDPEKDPNNDKDFAFYPTPKHVAKRMVELAEYDTAPDGDPYDTLEPSAGDGALLHVIPWGFGCRAIEFNHHRAQLLEKDFPQWAIIERDFLKWSADYEFDRILMNPPFNDRIEAVHLIKAWGHLKPGGILVAILPEGWFVREDLKSRILRAFLQKYEHRSPETLPAGTFGRTRIVTRIVTLMRPPKIAE